MNAAVEITILDVESSSSVKEVMKLFCGVSIVSVEALIRMRVEEEFNRLNPSLSGSENDRVTKLYAAQATSFIGGDEPKELEQLISKALDLFRSNGYFVIVDDKQYENLDEEILLRDRSVVEFFKLIPLQGG